MYDIFFLSYDESIADKNFELISERYPLAKRVNGIEGILAAHQECARQSKTDMFWVIDADSKIKPSFKLENIVIPDWDKKYTHLWYSKNAVNGLEYGNGGLKLFQKKEMINKPQMGIDMTVEFNLKIHEEVASINCFNHSPLSAWQSAFRECVKLSKQDCDIARNRLETWCSVGKWRKNGQFTIDGAIAGRNYGITSTKITKINDFNWLQEKFNEFYK